METKRMGIQAKKFPRCGHSLQGKAGDRGTCSFITDAVLNASCVLGLQGSQSKELTAQMEARGGYGKHANSNPTC